MFYDVRPWETFFCGKTKQDKILEEEPLLNRINSAIKAGTII